MITIKVNDWWLTGYYPYVTVLRKSAELGTELNAIFEPIKAKVPGSIYKDLLNAGKIEDPYFEMQSLNCEWVSQRWWKYSAVLHISKEKKGRNFRLRLNGIDYKATIFFNNKQIGQHEGMYIPFVYNISDQLNFNSENSISVVIEHAPDEMGQIGYTNRTFTQKARFTYKWDFCTRLIGMGLYDDVLIEDFGCAAIDYVKIKPVKINDAFLVECDLEFTGFETKECRVNYRLEFEDKIIDQKTNVISVKKGDNQNFIALNVKSPKLWDVVHCGEQNLYKLQIVISDENGISDIKEYRVGLKTVDYCCTEDANEDALKYIPIINGKKVYIKGVNMTPLDLMHGCVTREDYYKHLKNLADNNVNLIRVWGGGIIETDDFYDLCDAFGIMVWQEFIQSSSGINNTPSKRPEFLELIAKTTKHTVKIKRNHACLIFWSGGNELCDENGNPSTFEDDNIKMLLDIVTENDETHLMLPTSASGPNFMLNVNKPTKNHDVHGNWKYGGVKEHYITYNISDSMLHSEFGADAMTNYNKLHKILSVNHLDRVYSMSENSSWRHHGDWWGTIERDNEIFYNIDIFDLEKYIKISQVIQAEAIRYALLANRRRAFHNAGSIVWQYNECFPNISCTSLVDFWGEAKLAFKFMSEAYSTFVPCLKYDQIVWEKGEIAHADIFIVSDMDFKSACLNYKLMDFEQNILSEKKYKMNINTGATFIDKIEFNVEDSICYYIELSLRNGQDEIKSTYMFLSNRDGQKCDCNAAIKLYDLYLSCNKV